MLKKALKIANKAHKGQFRKHSGLPYLIHPLEVAKQLTIWEIKDEEMIAAAILHDAIEDSKQEKQLALEEKIKRLSFRIYLLVRQLTFNPIRSKEDYLETFKNENLTSETSLIIKVADRLCNIRDFLLVNDGYSKKYIGKSKVLLDALESRKYSIEIIFGSVVYDRIHSDFSQLFTI